MSSPIAYLITWTAYGSWLRGDARGWAKRHASGHDRYESPNEVLHARDAHRAAGDAEQFDPRARELIGDAIRRVCEHRGWDLHAVNPRSNHVHVVVSAPVSPERVMNDLKAWATRRLRADGVVPASGKVWTKHGSTRYLNDDASVARAIRYVLHEQDGKRPGDDAPGS